MLPVAVLFGSLVGFSLGLTGGGGAIFAVFLLVYGLGVPALVTFSGMGIQRAIGTSLLIITLVSASGTASHLLTGKHLSLETPSVFTLGSIAGLFAGSWLAQRLAGPALQKVFATASVAVASYVILCTF